MNLNDIVIRPGAPADQSGLLAIYNHYVLHSNAVFDEAPATLHERAAWFAQYRSTGPHRLLVAAIDERVYGWVSSQRFRHHEAFRDCVETSIMLSPAARGVGLGSRLYAHLFELLAAESVHRVYAGVALPNPASCRLHEKMGFRRVGVFSEYALKHGNRISSVWYEKPM